MKLIEKVFQGKTAKLRSSLGLVWDYYDTIGHNDFYGLDSYQ